MQYASSLGFAPTKSKAPKQTGLQFIPELKEKKVTIRLTIEPVDEPRRFTI
jgi:hypothetical protein